MVQDPKPPDLTPNMPKNAAPTSLQPTSIKPYLGLIQRWVVVQCSIPRNMKSTRSRHVSEASTPAFPRPKPASNLKSLCHPQSRLAFQVKPRTLPLAHPQSGLKALRNLRLVFELAGLSSQHIFPAFAFSTCPHGLGFGRFYNAAVVPHRSSFP